MKSKDLERSKIMERVFKSLQSSNQFLIKKNNFKISTNNMYLLIILHSNNKSFTKFELEN